MEVLMVTKGEFRVPVGRWLLVVLLKVLVFNRF